MSDFIKGYTYYYTNSICEYGHFTSSMSIVHESSKQMTAYIRWKVKEFVQCDVP